MNIIQAKIENIKELSQLFAEYRVFYGQNFDIDKSINFLTKRLTNNESVIFIAIDNSKFCGFVQLYPSFTSIGIQAIWILNDLFVSDNHTQKGIAKMLIKHVLKFSKETDRKKVILSTAHNNQKAQQLYEKLEFKRTSFYNYEKLTE